ncbi:MAG TPA: anti-sigma factor [Dehalococcoidia bacterium]|nr:anti-sigma factor [Dehalococcoidia bacterium]
MKIECDQAEELLAAFALERLDREEEEAMTEHLASCRRHDAGLAAFRAVVSALPLSAEELSPPPRLKASLLDAFDREVAGRALRRHATRPPLPRRVLASPAFAYALAAVLAVIAVGLGAWNISLREREAPAVVRVFNQGGMSMRLVYLREEQVAVLEVNMPALRADQTYQAWKVPKSGAPVSLGLLGNRGTFAFSASLDDATAVAISVEPAPGSLQPTTTPVIVQEF